VMDEVDFKQRKGRKWRYFFALNSGFMILWGRALADNLITCAFSCFSCKGAARKAGHKRKQTRETRETREEVHEGWRNGREWGQSGFEGGIDGFFLRNERNPR